MRIGVAGAGRIGAGHAQILASHPDVEEVVVFDLSTAAADALAAGLGGRTAASMDELLGQIDGLLIATATPTHPALIGEAVAAGVPTLCEKPVAADSATARGVLELVERAAARVQIGFHRRFDAGYAAAREAVATGQLGELRRAHLVICDAAPPPAAFIPTSGGIYRDMVIHDLDALRFVSGREIVEVFATGVNRGESFFGEAGDVDECVGVLVLDDGTLATLQSSRYNGNGYDCRMELAGTLATRVVGLDDRAPLRSVEPGVSFPAGEPWMAFRERFGPAYRAEMYAFVDFARGRRDNPCSVADALAASYAADALDLAAREHRPVRVSEVMPTAL